MLRSLLPTVVRSAPRRARALVAGLTRAGSLRAQVLRGGLWLGAGDALARGAGVIKVILLGRLLAPHDFGLMAVALVTLAWLEYFTETGFRAALIQRRDAIDDYLDTAFTVQLVRGLLLCAAIWASAPWVGGLFGIAEATPVVRAIAAVALMRGLSNPAAVATLRRELDFGREVAWRSGGVAAGLLAAIATALVWPDVRALIVSVLVAQAVETLLSYRVVRHSPRFGLDRGRARELLRFGRWIFAVNAMTFLALYLDTFAVGRILGPTALGLYQVAIQIGFLVTSQFGTHVHGVLFPAFSRLRDTRALREAWLGSLAIVGVVALPIAAALAGFGGALLPALLGDRWAAAAPALGPLALAGAAVALSRLSSALLQAAGRPQIAVFGAVVELVVLIGTIHGFTTRWGIAGAALAVAAARGAAAVTHLGLAARYLGTGPGRLGNAFLPGLWAASAYVAAAMLPASGAARILPAALGLVFHLAALALTARSVWHGRGGVAVGAQVPT